MVDSYIVKTYLDVLLWIDRLLYTERERERVSVHIFKNDKDYINPAMVGARQPKCLSSILLICTILV